MNEVATVEQSPPRASTLVGRMAERFGVEPNRMLATLKATAFRGEVSNEQMMALLVVAEQHSLNPWLKEIYAFPDKNNGIVPVVGVDGWSRIINGHPQMNGVEFIEGPADKMGLPEFIECRIFRKDRDHPTAVREYMAECRRSTGPWGSHPRRMLRWKALIQCARVAFSFAGIYDEDEAARIIDANIAGRDAPGIQAVENINARIVGREGHQEPPESLPSAEPVAPAPNAPAGSAAAPAPDSEREAMLAADRKLAEQESGKKK